MRLGSKQPLRTRSRSVRSRLSQARLYLSATQSFRKETKVRKCNNYAPAFAGTCPDMCDWWCEQFILLRCVSFKALTLFQWVNLNGFEFLLMLLVIVVLWQATVSAVEKRNRSQQRKPHGFKQHWFVCAREDWSPPEWVPHISGFLCLSSCFELLLSVAQQLLLKITNCCCCLAFRICVDERSSVLSRLPFYPLFPLLLFAWQGIYIWVHLIYQVSRRLFLIQRNVLE